MSFIIKILEYIDDGFITRLPLSLIVLNVYNVEVRLRITGW